MHANIHAHTHTDRRCTHRTENVSHLGKTWWRSGECFCIFYAPKWSAANAARLCLLAPHFVPDHRVQLGAGGRGRWRAGFYLRQPLWLPRWWHISLAAAPGRWGSHLRTQLCHCGSEASLFPFISPPVLLQLLQIISPSSLLPQPSSLIPLSFFLHFSPASILRSPALFGAVSSRLQQQVSVIWEIIRPRHLLPLTGLLSWQLAN